MIVQKQMLEIASSFALTETFISFVLSLTFIEPTNAQMNCNFQRNDFLQVAIQKIAFQDLNGILILILLI